MIRSALAVLALAQPAWSCGAETGALPMTGPDGSPVIHAQLPRIILSQPFDVQLCGALDGAVSVDATMPAHQHGMNYEPVVKSLGDGSVEASGLVFHMPGLWRLEVAVRRGDAVQRYRLELTVP